MKNFDKLWQSMRRDVKVNQIICAIFILTAIYLTSLPVFNREFLHPFLHQEYDGNRNSTWNAVDIVDIEQSVISLVVLWIAALVCGWLTNLIGLPNLLGVLLCGIGFRNLPSIKTLLIINESMNSFLRKAALTVILIRGGIGLDFSALKNQKGAILRLGILTPCIESAAISLGAHFFMDIDWKLSAIFGTVLAATSPAVTIPTMIGLDQKGYGRASGIPTVVLASAAIDNMICLTFTNIVLSLTLSQTDAKVQTAMIVMQILVGACVGISLGIFMWYFPSEALTDQHFVRATMLLSICFVYIFGGDSIGWMTGGVISTIVTSIVVSIKWKNDNNEKINIEAKAFACIWNLFGMEIMFALIGYGLDLTILELRIIAVGLIITAGGVALRILSVLLLISFSDFTCLERLFLSISFLPKATVQAALVPQILAMTRFTKYESSAILIMEVCVIAIVLTAPIGQFILQIAGPCTLSNQSPQNNQDSNGQVHPVAIPIIVISSEEDKMEFRSQ